MRWVCSLGWQGSALNGRSGDILHRRHVCSCGVGGNGLKAKIGEEDCKYFQLQGHEHE